MVQFLIYGNFSKTDLSPKNLLGKIQSAKVLRYRTYPNVKYDNDFTTFVKFSHIRNPAKFGIYLKITKKSSFANSSPSCVLAHGQQFSFKLAFSAIKCSWTHSCVCPNTAAIHDNWWYVITNLLDIRLCAVMWPVRN